MLFTPVTYSRIYPYLLMASDEIVSSTLRESVSVQRNTTPYILPVLHAFLLRLDVHVPESISTYAGSLVNLFIGV